MNVNVVFLFHCRNNPSRLEDKFDQLVRTIALMNSTLQTLVAEFRTQRLGRHSVYTSSTSNISVRSADSVAVRSRSGYEAVITAEQRSILCRTLAIVSTDSEQIVLEQEPRLVGRRGAFFKVLVKTLEERLTNTSDTSKTAISCLRTLYYESYLAERVKMAGYKRGKFETVLKL